jgi:hypothetical protein
MSSCVELDKFYQNICRFCLRDVWLRSYSCLKYIHFANFFGRKISKLARLFYLDSRPLYLDWIFEILCYCLDFRDLTILGRQSKQKLILV